MLVQRSQSLRKVKQGRNRKDERCFALISTSTAWFNRLRNRKTKKKTQNIFEKENLAEICWNDLHCHRPAAAHPSNKNWFPTKTKEMSTFLFPITCSVSLLTLTRCANSKHGARAQHQLFVDSVLSRRQDLVVERTNFLQLLGRLLGPFLTLSLDVG